MRYCSFGFQDHQITYLKHILIPQTDVWVLFGSQAIIYNEIMALPVSVNLMPLIIFSFGINSNFLRLPFSLKLILFYYVNMAIFDVESTLMTGSYFVSAIHVEKWLFLVSIIARMSPQYFDLNIVKFTCNLSNYDLLDLENI